ncbi:PREDICTED: F-box/kelch-repeat protein At5g26960 [Nelumbo nucifera]|uniref:F-box/kelch-repeat protein At5g26960 n=1 Tax=Nelumbo nucifera TaxID=4432 RepID=A0A1U7Z288_NELNU|nr:PREDICTED: F-box/kelch-repeat protein At5g26960 [Nelumbo nucifera]
MAESCNSRGFSWLVKSCFPNPQHETRRGPTLLTRISDKNPPESRPENRHHKHETTFSFLPDDILLECLSRVSPSSLPSVSLVCRKWSQLLDSPGFYDLRRNLGHLRQTVFAVAFTDYGVYATMHRIGDETSWRTTSFPAVEMVAPEIFDGSFSHARLTAIGRHIYIIGRNATIRYDTWTGVITSRAPMIFPRKKFAAAVVAGKIYVTGGGGASRTSAVEQYDPETDTWRVAAESPRRRYGCIGAAVDGVFYSIGGLKIGGVAEATRGVGSEAHVYASSMDLYDVEARAWLRSRAVPGGGCVVAACAAGGYIYVLASHAVELSFWRYDGRRKSGGFGEWCRMKSPPLPAQVRLDSTVRFCCVGVGEKVVLVQAVGCIDDLLRRSGRSCRGLKEGLVLVFDYAAGEWSRGADLPAIIRRAACVCVEC